MTKKAEFALDTRLVWDLTVLSGVTNYGIM